MQNQETRFPRVTLVAEPRPAAPRLFGCSSAVQLEEDLCCRCIPLYIAVALICLWECTVGLLIMVPIEEQTGIDWYYALLYVLLVKLVFYLLPAAIPKRLVPRITLFVTYVVASALEGAAVLLTAFAYLHDECEEAEEACDRDGDAAWYWVAGAGLCALFIAFKVYFSTIIWRFYVELRDQNVVKREDGADVIIETGPHPAFGDLGAAQRYRD